MLPHENDGWIIQSNGQEKCMHLPHSIKQAQSQIWICGGAYCENLLRRQIFLRKYDKYHTHKSSLQGTF